MVEEEGELQPELPRPRQWRTSAEQQLVVHRSTVLKNRAIQTLQDERKQHLISR